MLAEAYTQQPSQAKHSKSHDIAEKREIEKEKPQR